MQQARRLLKKLPRLVGRGVAATPASASSIEEMWFQDEARVGQKGQVSHIWAADRLAVRLWCATIAMTSVYLFGAICHARGTGAAIIMPVANAVRSMNEHLKEISMTRSRQAHMLSWSVTARAGNSSRASAYTHQCSTLILPPTALLTGTQPNGEHLGLSPLATSSVGLSGTAMTPRRGPRLQGCVALPHRRSGAYRSHRPTLLGMGQSSVGRWYETVQNLGVITPLNETDAGSNFRLRHAHGGGLPTARPTGSLWIDCCWCWTGRAG